MDKCSTFSLDLETNGLNPVDSKILLCQVGTGNHEYVIDARKVDLTPLVPFLESRNWLKLIFTKFEDKFFQYFFQTQINNVFDCFLAERVINPDSSYNNSFEDLALKYLDVQLKKEIRKGFLKPIKDFTEAQIKYAAEDVQYLFPLWRKQKALLEERGLVKIADLEFTIIPVVSRMELTGVKIDVPKWRGIIRGYQDRLHEHEQNMFKIFFDDNDTLTEQLGMFERRPMNLQSPAQLKKAFQGIGIDLENTDERTLEKVNHPAAKELLKHRKVQKVLNAYGDNIINKIHPFTGRIHADFKQLGTETGRFSCKEPNLQQMPKEFRECFIAGDDFSFVGADYSQIELRILADISGDARLRAAFNSGADVHVATAASMFDVPLAEVTPEQRFAAKTLNFGMMYGMGIDKLKDSLNLENTKNGKPLLNIRQVQSIHTRYKKTYLQATRWLENAGRKAIDEGYSETMYGRKRFYNRPTSSIDRKSYERQLGAIARQGANSPIQGTSADITKLAMDFLYRDLKDYGYKGNIVLQVHDEIVVLAHKTQAEAIKLVVEESMITAAQMILTHVPVKVDTFIADTWHK